MVEADSHAAVRTSLVTKGILHLGFILVIDGQQDAMVEDHFLAARHNISGTSASAHEKATALPK